MIEQGILRRPYDYSLETHFVPQLYGQVLFDLVQNREQIDSVDAILNFTMRQGARDHKDALVKEAKRKEEKKKEELS